jgi:hypothetical protein
LEIDFIPSTHPTVWDVELYSFILENSDLPKVVAFTEHKHKNTIDEISRQNLNSKQSVNSSIMSIYNEEDDESEIESEDKKENNYKSVNNKELQVESNLHTAFKEKQLKEDAETNEKESENYSSPSTFSSFEED